MPEGFLSIGTTPGSYAIDSLTGTDLVNEQAVEVFLAGQWIAGHIADSGNAINVSTTTTGNRSSLAAGMYHIADNKNDDSVMEASEESFPASDPPAWIETDNDTILHTFHGPYFVADVDGSICGLCIGMRIRT